MPREVTHLYDPGRKLTYCGKSLKQYSVRGVRYWRVHELPIISPNQLVDEATCKACQRVDDAVQVRNYQRECREANIDPDTLQPFPKAKS